jgi:hypothetical protein
VGGYVYIGTEKLEFNDGFSLQTYTPYRGRSGVQHFVDEGCAVVAAHPLLFRRAHQSEGARSSGARDCIRVGAVWGDGTAVTMPGDHLRASDHPQYREVRALIEELIGEARLKEENAPLPVDQQATIAHLLRGLRDLLRTVGDNLTHALPGAEPV